MVLSPDATLNSNHIKRARALSRGGIVVAASILLLGSLACPHQARADAGSDDTDALLLADTAPKKVETASDWQWYVEGAIGQSTLRNLNPGLNGARQSNQRLSLDVQFDKSIAPGWRAVFADRLDLNWPAQIADQHPINTLKEAYRSWQPNDSRVLDFGRINARNGVALGYNPTDFFRAGAARSVVSVDPASLKKNRLGSVMLRGQTLWTGGSLTALYSPRLESAASDAAFNPDLGATNNQNRWLLAASQKLSENFNPQFLIYGVEHQSPQLGFNLTSLVGDATVVFAEWSGGRARSQLSQALAGVGGAGGNLDDSAFRNRVATGVSYTTSNKLSLTVEYDYNGAALDEAGWNSLMRSPTAYGQYRRAVQTMQDLPTRQAVFLYASWQDAMISHLDLSAMLRFNVADKSRLNWFEARYHWERVDLALQWQLNSGSASSEFGAAPQNRALQALLRYYF
ncbi:hypothetical protein BH11PSE11_BH11PSE11_18600 [soil metagenome]